MSRIEIECHYDCPHCGTGWVMGDEGIYTDDIEDECTTTCGECGGVFQLRCKSVEVEMEATVVDVVCTCPTLDGVKVVGSACPVHGFESCEL